MTTSRQLALTVCLASLIGGVVPALAATPTSRLGVASTSAGKLITGNSGRTLYVLTSDRTGAASSCYGRCAEVWPPVIATRKPTAGPGVKAGLIGLSRRRDGRRQVTYKGRPLYLYSEDTARGEISGAGVTDYFGSWRAVGPDGRTVAK